MNKLNNILNRLKQKPYLGVLTGLGLILIYLLISTSLFQSPQTPTGNHPSNKIISPTIVFPTVTSAPLTQEEKNKLQTKFDQDTVAKENELYSSYPWFDKLPLKSTDYFVYFDTAKKSFVGLLYPDNSNPSLTISQTVTMKAQIRKSLTDLGIDITKYKLEWVIKPENKSQ